MPMLAYDPARLDLLRRAMGAAVDDLLCMRCDDFAARDTTLMIRTTCGSLADLWLPRINEVLHSKSMSSGPRTTLNDGPRGGGAPLTGPLWNMIEDRGTRGYPAHDPAPLMYGPERPGTRSFGQVLDGYTSGAMRPMAAPLDANGIAGAHYKSLSITPCEAREVGHADLTTDLNKFIDFWSDGLPIGWKESSELTILYLPKARVVSTAYTLEAYDRDTGPEPLPGLTTEATVSGYLILRHHSGTATLNMQIGPGIQDPTASFPIISETSSEYSGVFIPDNPPDFKPVTGPCVGGAPAWTFTTSASPEVDGWGTYGICAPVKFWGPRSRAALWGGVVHNSMVQIDRLRAMPRPLAYVLPGGGVLAAYQVGVLDALTAAGLRPDRLIGVSAGALNAALYAWSSDVDGVRRIERIWAGVRRRDLLRVHPGRLALALAGKRTSFLDNRHGISFLRKHLGARLIEHAPIPLTIIATDLATGRPFAIDSGDVVSAIVASSAFPGVFPPIEIDGHVLIDGGVVADVPLDVAGELGAAGVIVVTVPPLAPAPVPQHPVGVVLRSSTWGVEAHGRTIVARPPHGMKVIEIPSHPSSVTTFAVGSASATIEEARRFTTVWLQSAD